MAKKYQIVLLCFLAFQVFYGQRNNQQFRFTECASTPQCNLVFNGNFEEFDVLPNALNQLERACNWINGYGSPDYYNAGVSTPMSPVDIPGLTVANPNPVVNPLFGGSAYAGIEITRNEVTNLRITDLLATKLVQTLQANTNYVLEFDIRKSSQNRINTSINIQACLAVNPLPIAPTGDGSFVLGALDLVETNSYFSTNTTNWDRLTFNFTTGNTAGQEYLLIGGIQYVLFQDEPFVNDNMKKAYYYIDNVVLKKAFNPSFDLPSSICSNGTPINLSQLVGNTTDTFSGPGVTLIAGEYFFNPSIAGVGNHNINYTATSIDGCDVVALTDTIEVTNCTPPTPPYISQVFKTNGKDRFIEIKNADNTIAITPGIYYLAFYQNNTLLTGAPTYSVPLGNIPANGVDLFKSIPTTAPAYALSIATDFPDLQQFDGENDIMIITTSNDTNAYANRVDELGDYSGNSIFYKDYTQEEYKSLVRVSCMPLERQAPQNIYDEQDWVGFNKTYDFADDAEVFTQTAKTNDVLGRHYNETIEWIGGIIGWDDLGILDPANESLPDRSRNVVIRQPYDTSLGNFEACSLLSNNNLKINPLNNVKVQTSVNSTVPNGIEVLNQGSLIQVRDSYYGVQNQDLISAISQNSMKHSRETVGLNRGTDYVYWSSPLSLNAINKKAGQIFGFGSAIGQFNPSRFYRFENQNFYDMVNTYGDNGSGTDGYDDNLNDYMPFSFIPTAINEPFIPGRGYATWPPISSSGLFTNYVADYTITFEGEMNNGKVTVPVYRNDSQYGTDSNLVGNPYPSPIDLEKFLYDTINKDLIRPVAFIWGRFVDDTPLTTNPGPDLLDYIEDNFKIYNPDMTIDPTQAPYSGNEFINDGTLASCQSFFVMAKDPDNGGNPIYNTGLIETLGNIRFSNYMRTTKPNNTFSRTSQFNQATNRNNTSSSDKLWVNLTDANGYTVQLGLTFKEDGSATYNQDEDIETVHGRKYNFYTQTTSKDLIIDVQDEFNTSKEIPLGILNNNSIPNQVLTISIPRKAGVFNTQPIYLYDSETGITHNITTSSFSFTSNQVITEGRFKLIFESNTSTIVNKQSSDVICLFNQNGLTLSSITSEIESYEVYDLEAPKSTGYLIASEKNTDSKSVSLPLEGKYKLISVKIKLNDGTQVAKKLAR